MNSHYVLKAALIVLLSISNLMSQTITIGTIDTEPENKFSKFEALSDYLQNKLKKNKILINVEIPKDIDTAISLIKHNKLDIFIDSVYPTMVVQKATPISIELKRWKKGSEGYKSVIFTNKGSKINLMQDLVGKIIAFEDEFSTSAYYIPKKIIEKHGLILSNTSGKNAVKYSFSRTENNAAAWVLYKKVDVAVTDDLTYDSFDKNLFKVIYKSKLIPRHLVSFSKRVNAVLKEKIINILYDMHNDQDGIAVLKLFSKTKKFSPLTKNDWKILNELK